MPVRQPPIRCGVAVTRLSQRDGAGFIAATADGTIAATMSSSPPVPISRHRPGPAARSSRVQVHASGYRNPEQLPPGAVLVAGAGASGAQIAEEFLRAGRRVYLSVGRHRRLPRRYRGRDLIWWLADMRLDQVAPEKRGPARLSPVISGAYGGRTIDFRGFAADGVILLGRIEAAHHGVIEIAPGLAETLPTATSSTPPSSIRSTICEAAPPRPAEDPDARTTLPTALRHRAADALDLAAEGISAVIWATGYGIDFSWIDLPVRTPGRTGPPQRHIGGAGPVFPRPAMAVEDELLLPVRRRRRRGRARR